MKKRRYRNPKRADPTKEKCWTYIGRFLWQFGIIESYVSEIFLLLYDLENVSWPFIGLIDTRKKLQLIHAGLLEQGRKDHKRVLDDVHELHNLRNVIAHSCFFESDEGINVDHITNQGQRWMQKKGEEDNYLSFAELDRIYKDSLDLVASLLDLHESISPISSPSREFSARVEEIIDASPNVIRYHPPKK
jgi:hypothetical protein